MSLRVSCPFCNTTFVLPGMPAGGRAACPRCGDTFTVRVSDEEVGESSGAPVVHAAGLPVASHPSSLHTNRSRRSVRSVIVVAGCIGLLGLGIGLSLNYLGGGDRAKPPPVPDSLPSAGAVPPAQLAGLGFLRADCNLVLAVQPGPLLTVAAHTGREPRDLLRAAGLPDSALDRLGLTLSQIDHIAAGARVPDQDDANYRLTVALVLRRPPADEELFLRAMDARRSPLGKAGRYEVTFGKLPLQLARVSATVWVFGWSEGDLEPVDRGGFGPGVTRLSAGLRELITEKLPPDAAAWVAADEGRWAERPLVKLAVAQAGKPEWLPLLAKARAAVAGVNLDEPARVRAFVRCADTATGEQLRAYFAARMPDGGRSDGAGEWAMFDAPFDPRAGTSPLRQLLDDAGK